MMTRKTKRILASVLAGVLGLIAIGWMWLAAHYDLPPIEAVTQAARRVATPALAVVYQSDHDELQEITRSYQVGSNRVNLSRWQDSWRNVERRTGALRLLEIAPRGTSNIPSPFVYQRADAEFLRELRETFDLEAVVEGAPTEYEAMLRLGAWVGTRWDHGDDRLAGSSQVCDPVAVIEAGQKGARYWCEIAARTLVHAASSLGWPARVITASTNGYTPEHAVAELWSNQYRKWFVVDPDFNVVYESRGIPMSAWELSHEGPRLQSRDMLVMRQIAPPKPSLKPADLLPLYAYVHVDMRSDWCSRPLRRGSPTGGDLATWWTARPTFHELLTARVRVDDPGRFNWPVNAVAIEAVDVRSNGIGQFNVSLALAGYSPTLRQIEMRVDGSEWRPASPEVQTITLKPGNHTVEARLVSRPYDAPATRVHFNLLDAGVAASHASSGAN